MQAQMKGKMSEMSSNYPRAVWVHFAFYSWKRPEYKFYFTNNGKNRWAWRTILPLGLNILKEGQFLLEIMTGIFKTVERCL